jgi:hypothetical protein
MTDPTPQNIVDALVRAKELVERHDFDLIRALAEATTTAQCQGIHGFKVFRDTRAAVGNLTAANRATAITALDNAIKKVGS